MPRFDVTPEPQMHPAAAAVWHTIEFSRQMLLKEMDGLSPEQLAARPAQFKNSLAALLCHTAGAEIAFAYRLRGEKVPDEYTTEYWLGSDEGRIRQPEGETVESLTAKFNKARAILKEALAALKEEDLERLIERPNDVQYTVRWMLSLIAFHPGLHSGHMQMVRQHLPQ